jgi:urease accessory protein
VRAALALLLSVATGLAYAHSATRGPGDFYAGLLHPLTALEHVLPFLALGLLAGQQGRNGQSAALAFPLALMAGAAGALWLPSFPYVALLNIVSAVALGGLVAAGLRLPVAVLLGTAIVFGLTHGLANGQAISAGIKPYLFIPGVGLAGLLVLVYAIMMVDFVSRRKANWMQIAVRVAGSWIAAIGLLVLATSGKAILAS